MKSTAPIAERLGLYAVKLELEDLGFRALYPYRYKVLERELKRARGNQKEFIGKIAETFKGTLKKAEIAGGVEGREKHLYSIYKKMQNKGISLNEMVDVYGFRIIVDSADTCYRVLGLVHSVYKPMPGRFKDYIAIPRVNGYQSLHTTLFGPNGIPIEVQIRSEQMHRVAESGIAAHWKYKSGGDSFGGVEHDRAREWLASLVQIQEGGSSEEFLESVKVDLFPDKVYVFTPKGKILRLPSGATTVDFAYAIHTDVGENRCVAAKVDRRLVLFTEPRCAARPNGGDHHGKGRHAQSLLVDLPGDGEGARRDQSLLEKPQARRSAGTGEEAAGSGARGILAQPEENSAGGHRCRGQRIEYEGRRRVVRENRLG